MRTPSALGALRFSRKETFKISASFLAIAVAFSGYASLASAHTDPVSCDSTGVSLSLTVLRADGTTPVGGGSVTPGETIKYRATLSFAGGSNCNYEGGSLAINTPDAVNHNVGGGTIPLISSGVPFVGTIVSYVVNSANVVSGHLPASAVYTGGTSHLGDTDVTPVGANAAASTLFAKASPSIGTTPSAGGPIGTVLNDTASLTGGSSPTGTVTFKLFPPSDASCSGAASYTDADTTAPYDTSTSGDGFTSNAAGVWHWTASYAGDANNNAVSSSCESETATVTKATPQIQTTPTPASGPIGTLLNDTATVTGGSNPTGSVTFNLYAPADSTCLNPIFTSVDPDAAYASTPGFTSNVAGTYHWTASYAGDANNVAVASGCLDEPVSIDKAAPTIGTTLSSLVPVAIGTTVHDSATLTNATGTAGGTVQYTVYTDSACTLGAQDAGNKAVTNGTVLDSNGIQFNSAGTFYWQAVYSGDANNGGATSTCQSETLLVQLATPTLSTEPSAGGAIGTVLNDTASLTGGSNPTGSVTFKLYPPSDASCEGPASYTETDPTAPYATSAGFASNAVGVWHWTASYPGDANNAPASSACESESVTITKASPAVQTLQSAGGAIGTVLNDTATLTGGSSPTGNVTFKLFPPSDATCTGPASDTEISATAPYATSVGFTSNAAGVWHWTADYAGDANNNSGSSGCQAEPVTVGQASLQIGTTPSAGGVVGTVLNDTAILSGGSSPTGNVTFKLFPPSDPNCTGAASDTEVDSSAPYATSVGFTSNAAGVWHWTADYAGDGNNSPASSGCNAEPVTITTPEKASPGIQTTPSAGGTVGVVLNDTATLTGGSSPTGTVTFKLFPPSDPTCSLTASYTDADATAPYDTSTSGGGFTSNAAGVWHWTADYAGDANNNAVSSGCQAESATVTPASSSSVSSSSSSSICKDEDEDDGHEGGDNDGSHSSIHDDILNESNFGSSSSHSNNNCDDNDDDDGHSSSSHQSSSVSSSSSSHKDDDDGHHGSSSSHQSSSSSSFHGDGTVICHKPNGPHPQTMTVNGHALHAHLGHGDHLGPCVSSSSSSSHHGNDDNKDKH